MRTLHRSRRRARWCGGLSVASQDPGEYTDLSAVPAYASLASTLTAKLEAYGAQAVAQAPCAPPHPCAPAPLCAWNNRRGVACTCHRHGRSANKTRCPCWRSYPMLTTRPFQGPNYFCADCKAGKPDGPNKTWHAWCPGPPGVACPGGADVPRVVVRE